MSVATTKHKFKQAGTTINNLVKAVLSVSLFNVFGQIITTYMGNCFLFIIPMITPMLMLEVSRGVLLGV